jgi:hypothetical protein
MTLSFRTALAVLAVLLYGAVAHALPCANNCGHYMTHGSAYPFLEAIADQDVVVNGSSTSAPWVFIHQPCVAGTGELSSPYSFNAAIRVQYAIVSSDAPAGTSFETQIAVYQSSTLISQSIYTRKIKAAIGSDLDRQGEWFNSMATSLAAGDYDVYVSVRLLANANMTIDMPYVTAVGAPAVYGGGTSNNSTVQTVSGSWVKVSEASLDNNSSESVDIQMQSYMQFVSGTFGDTLSMGYGVDNVSSNGHNSTVHVPQYFPDSVNGFDAIPNPGNTVRLSPGHHVIQLWAKNLSGHTTSVQYCQIQALGFPQSDGYQAYAADAVGPITADNNPAVLPEQPRAFILLDRAQPSDDHPATTGPNTTIAPGAGAWTKLATIDIPPNTSPTGYNWTGGGFVDLVGRTGAAWTGSWCQLAVENIALKDPNNPSDFDRAIENGFVSYNVPTSGGSQVYFFIDAYLWGGGNGSKINLWVRKTAAGGAGAGQFTVGSAHLNVRLVDDQGHSCGQ